MIRLHPRPLPPLLSANVSLSESSCVSPVQLKLTGEGGSRIIRPLESWVLYKSFYYLLFFLFIFSFYSRIIDLARHENKINFKVATFLYICYVFPLAVSNKNVLKFQNFLKFIYYCQSVTEHFYPGQKKHF